MNLSAESQEYIANFYATVSYVTKQSVFSAIQFCTKNYYDSIRELCNAFHVSRSGYYKWLNRNRIDNKDARIVREIRKCQAISNYTLGYRKMAMCLRQQSITNKSDISIYRIMNKYNLLSRSVRTKKNSILNKEISPYPNLLKRDFSADFPNQKWCIDITQFYAKGKKLYMCAVIDLYDRSIVGYSFSDRENMSLVKRTLKQALKSRDNLEEELIILHSD